VPRFFAVFRFFHTVMSGKGGSFSKEEIAKHIDQLLKDVERALKMVDASKKSIDNNRQNVKDAESGAPGAPPVDEAKKSLASAEDLYKGHHINGQQKLNIVLANYEKAKGSLSAEQQARYQKVIEQAKSHGLSTNY